MSPMPPHQGRELAFQMRLSKTRREEQLRRIAVARGLVTRGGTLLPGGTDKGA